MAEICLDCLNKLDRTHLTEADVILEEDFCEECGQIVPCVMRYRTAPEKLIWTLFHRRKSRGIRPVYPNPAGI